MTEEDRICKTCGEMKSLSEFATYRRGGEIRPLRTCKDCHRIQERERQRRYIAKNRETHNRRSREYKRRKYQNDAEFREEHRRRSRAYYEENREDVLVKRSEHYHSVEKDRKVDKIREDEEGPSVRSFQPSYEDEFEELFDEIWRGDPPAR